MKYFYILIIALTTVLSATPALAQDDSYSLNTQNPVLTDNSQTIFLSGRLQSGWAGSYYNGSDPNIDQLENQFFINRAYLTLSGLLNEDIAFRIRLDCIGETDESNISLKNAYLRISNISYLGLTSRLYLGIVGSIWETFETEIWKYQVLRRISAGMFGYIEESEVGANYYMNFNDNRVSVRVGLWNGDYQKYSTLGFGTEVNEQFTDDNLSAGFFILFNQGGYLDKNSTYDGLNFAVGGMLNNKPGDDDEANSGYRLFSGLYYILNRTNFEKLLTIGISCGYINGHKRENEFSNLIIDNTYYGDAFIIVNLALFSAEARHFELIFRLDYNYDGRKGEGYLEPNDDIHQGAITIALAYKPYSWLSVIPAFMGDYVDIGRDVNLIGIWFELRY